MSRRLTAREAAMAAGVFGEAIDYARVRVGRGGFGRFAVTLGSRILAPPHLASPDYAAEPAAVRALFIHELTHVWQFQTRALPTLASWARVVARGGYGPGLPGYRYRLPLPDWRSLNLEQQASVVEHAYLLREGHGPTAAMPPGARLERYAGLTPFPRLGTPAGPRAGLSSSPRCRSRELF